MHDADTSSHFQHGESSWLTAVWTVSLSVVVLNVCRVLLPSICVGEGGVCSKPGAFTHTEKSQAATWVTLEFSTEILSKIWSFAGGVAAMSLDLLLL
jgi:hypothetical protein